MSKEKKRQPKDLGQFVVDIWSRKIPDRSRLIPREKFVPKVQVKPFAERPPGYPERLVVPLGTTWETLDRSNYNPQSYTSDEIKAKPKWADPADNPLNAQNRPFVSYAGDVKLDENGWPLHPLGPKGIRGRGDLGKWGKNDTVDALVTVIGDDGIMYMTAIKRKIDGKWAVPGGFRDENETVAAAQSRELTEETGVNLDFTEAIERYRGMANDPRDTDNAWIETVLSHIHLKRGTKLSFESVDEVEGVKLMPLTKENIVALYAGHGDMVLRSIKAWEDETGFVLDNYGRVGRPQRSFGWLQRWSMDTVDRRIQVIKHSYPHVGDIYELTNKGQTIYSYNGEVVYSSKENNKFTFSSLGGFLGTRNPERQVMIHIGNARPIALFGTINSNLPGVSAALDWMNIIQEDLGEESVYNPNLRSNVQSTGKINMAQFAEESKHLFESKVIFMNFEPLRGGLALAELRMAALGSIMTGHKLIVRMEQPVDDIHIIRSRAVAMADIDFLKEKFPQANIELIVSEVPAITEEELKSGVAERKLASLKAEYHRFGEIIKQALDEQLTGDTVQKLPLSVFRPEDTDSIILSGSSRTARDMAIRLELKNELEKIGKTVIDTYDPLFGGGPIPSSIEGKIEAIRKSRRDELETMFNANEQVIYVGRDSVSPFAQVTTALLIAALTGSRLAVVVDRGVDLESYSESTYRSHKTKALISGEVYQEMKIANLIGDLQTLGVAPELSDQIRVISDALQPVVDVYTIASRN